MADKEVIIEADDGGSRIRRERIAFPSNSYKTKKTEEERKPLAKITTGKVVQQKKGLGRKFSETFFGEDGKTVGQYIFHDILIPALKSMLSDAIGGGIEVLLFGERRRDRSNITRNGGRSYTSYGSYYRGDRERDGREGRREISQSSRTRHDFDDIILESRGEAEEVLSHLVDLTVDYGMACVADFYDLVGIDSNFTDNKYGWTDLRDASVRRCRSGYCLELPKTKLLE